LPISYRQSPYFTIDEDLLKQDHKQDLPECEPMSTEDGNKCDMNEESATFLIDDSEIMDQLKTTLIDSLKKVQDSLPSVENFLPLTVTE